LPIGARTPVIIGLSAAADGSANDGAGDRAMGAAKVAAHNRTLNRADKSKVARASLKAGQRSRGQQKSKNESFHGSSSA